MEARSLSPRIVSVAAFVTWLVLTALQAEWVPGLRHGWAFNLWRYFPPAIGWLLGGVALALCASPVRVALLRGARVVGTVAHRVGPFGLAAAVAVAFWLLRARSLSGDSGLLLLKTLEAWFYFPETGGTFLMWLGMRLGPAFGQTAVSGVQLLSCLCGGAVALLALPLARRLVPAGQPGLAPLAVALLASGGVARVFAGHVEVYAALLVGVTAYLWLALDAIAGRRKFASAALALGGCVWLHAAALTLVPSLLALAWLVPREADDGSRPARDAARGLALAAIPVWLFFALVALAGRRDEFVQAFELGLNILGITQDPSLMQAWVRPPGAPSIGTDVSFGSLAQLKYLVNASWLLVPFAIPGLLWIAIASPRALFDTRQSRFLLAVCAPLVLYALLLRPFWGPFDWDLFSLGAVALGCWVVHAATSKLDPSTFRDVAVVAIGFQLLYVGLPFRLMGIVDLADAGPFAPGYFDYELHLRGQPPSPALAPWL